MEKKICLKFKVPTRIEHLREKAEHGFHMLYLGAVGWEAHGMYKIAAIVAFAVAFAGLFVERAVEQGVE